MAGYYGYKMSNNAVEAYECGEMPLSKWTKSAIIKRITEMVNDEEVEINFTLENLFKLPAKTLKAELLTMVAWHHTSSWYNVTDFYGIDDNKLESLSDDDIKAFSEKKEEKKEEPKKEMWKCSFLEWSGSRNHPKATRREEVGMVKGNWFYICNGNKKKKTTANGFEFIERIN